MSGGTFSQVAAHISRNTVSTPWASFVDFQVGVCCRSLTVLVYGLVCQGRFNF